MDKEVVLGVIFVALLVLVALIAKLSIFFRTFAVYTHRICQQMDSAATYEEYRHWRGVLRCHYLMLIPFVTPKNVKRVCRFFFRDGGNAEKKERKDGLVPLLLPSVLGICICMVCLCGMTWAWYTVSIEAPAQKITTAYFKVTVDSIRIKSNPTEEASADSETNEENAISAPSADSTSDANEIPADNDGGYELEEGKTYTVVLTAAGTVKNSGYCLIEKADESEDDEGTKYYTPSMKPGERIKIEFIPENSGTYTFRGVWGGYPTGVDESDLIPGSQVENTGEDESPTVSPEPSETQPTQPVTEPTTAPEPPNAATDDPREVVVILD